MGDTDSHHSTFKFVSHHIVLYDAAPFCNFIKWDNKSIMIHYAYLW